MEEKRAGGHCARGGSPCASEARPMWCAECQLDVPALAVPEEPGVIRCAFCRGELAGRQEDRSQESGDRSQEPGARGQESGVRGLESVTVEAPRLLLVPPPAIDDWEGDAELRRVERLVTMLRQSHEREGEPSTGNESAENSPLGSQQTAREQPVQPPPAVESAGLAAWACLTLGLMAFVCGGVLLGWSFLADRGDLWSLGLPLTLAGQVGLVLGLLFQLDGLSKSSRRTEQTLTELDGQLDQLRDVTAMVSSTHSAPAHAFYSHMSSGATPQILLADLKGQLDLLAQQMARQRKAA